MAQRARTPQQVKKLREIEEAVQQVLAVRRSIDEVKAQQEMLAEYQRELEAQQAEALEHQWEIIKSADKAGLSVRTLATITDIPLATFHRQLKSRLKRDQEQSVSQDG